ncbi:MAG: hypothetical protein GX256_01770 [Fretibacterium sp.]|nr:hypothetical protein [Fretibacterium sp.]
MRDEAGRLLPLREEYRKPALFLWGGLGFGVFLLGDGLRRFLLPAGQRDLSAFLLYVILGVLCLSIATYRRAFILGEMGLEQETCVLGRRVKRLLLPWAAVVSASWEAGMARLGSDSVRWLIRLPPDQKEAFCEWVRFGSPNVEVLEPLEGSYSEERLDG